MEIHFFYIVLYVLALIQQLFELNGAIMGLSPPSLAQELSFVIIAVMQTLQMLSTMSCQTTEWRSR